MLAAPLLLLLLTETAISPRTAPVVYRIDLVGHQTIWSQDRPVERGGVLVFRRHPDGVVVSVRKGDVSRVRAAPIRPASSLELRPGEERELGTTATAARDSAAPGPAGSVSKPAAAGPLRPGEGKGGTALFNPDRAYRPDWDSKLVPGGTMPLPNSPNDYREGLTLSHPAAGAVQTVPGDVPRAPE